MKFLLISIIIFSFCFQPFGVAKAESIAARLSGYILLQVESNGEAWYINPDDNNRYYLGRPDDAFRLMRKLGLGVSEKDYNSYKNNNYTAPNILSGKIILRVEANGEAYYINPADNKLHYLGRPADAFDVMRNLGLGISNNDIARININAGDYSEVDMASLKSLEKKIHDLINIERSKENLSNLSWNEEVAQVAREHSENLARENVDLTRLGYTCDFPFIHHEGFDFGLYHDDRLINRSVYYASQSAENIALVPRVSYLVSYESSLAEEKATNCNYRRDAFNKTFNEALKAEDDDNKKALDIQIEINKRKEALKDESALSIVEKNWSSEDDLARSTVNGWMNSAGHKANILEGDYTQAGMGVAYINGYLIVTQVFITRAHCGYKNGVCCQKEGYYPYCYSPYGCYNNICQ